MANSIFQYTPPIMMKCEVLMCTQPSGVENNILGFVLIYGCEQIVSWCLRKSRDTWSRLIIYP